LRHEIGAAILIVILMAFCVAPNPMVEYSSSQGFRGTVILDYSHGQDFDTGYPNVDHHLEGNLSAMGYDVIWARGGINSSILEGCTALIMGPIFGYDVPILQYETEAIAAWFSTGNKFLWVGNHGDFEDTLTGPHETGNMSLILNAVGSHVYAENGELWDEYSNCGEGYRVVANITCSDPFLQPIVVGVERVLTHGGTILYGSDSETPGMYTNPVTLEETSIENVYPLLWSSQGSYLLDYQDPEMLAHEDFTIGSFVVCTLELYAGVSGTGVLIVSGASPYGNNRPMFFDCYREYPLDGHLFVMQGIDYGIELAKSLTVPISTPSTSTTSNTNGYDGGNIIPMILGVAAVPIAVMLVLYAYWRRYD